MKRFIRLLSIFVLLFILINHIIAYFYEGPIRKAISNKTHIKYLKWKEIKNYNNKIDLVYMGSSRGYCAYNPIYIDSVLKLNSYNMCTGSQDIIETIYILKEMLRFQKPKYVIYDVFLPSFSKRTDFYPVFSNARFMSLTGKKEMIFYGYGLEGGLNIVFPVYKHRNYIRKDLLTLLYPKRRKNGSTNLLNRDEVKWYKGYCYNIGQVDSTIINNFSEIYNFDNTNVSLEKLNDDFNAFVELCRQQNIKLICVRAPYPPSRLAISPKDTVTIYFKLLCEKNSVPYYDFNYMDNKKYEYTDQDFADYHHMNYYGAKKVSAELAEIILNYQ